MDISTGHSLSVINRHFCSGRMVFKLLGSFDLTKRQGTVEAGSFYRKHCYDEFANKKKIVLSRCSLYLFCNSVYLAPPSITESEQLNNFSALMSNISQGALYKLQRYTVHCSSFEFLNQNVLVVFFDTITEKLKTAETVFTIYIYILKCCSISNTLLFITFHYFTLMPY